MVFLLLVKFGLIIPDERMINPFYKGYLLPFSEFYSVSDRWEKMASGLKFGIFFHYLLDQGKRI